MKKMEEKEPEWELFINGIPNIKLIPQEIAQALLCSLEQDISNWVSEKNKNFSSIKKID